jgi:hypothetical protein
MPTDHIHRRPRVKVRDPYIKAMLKFYKKDSVLGDTLDKPLDRSHADSSFERRSPPPRYGALGHSSERRLLVKRSQSPSRLVRLLEANTERTSTTTRGRDSPESSPPFLRVASAFFTKRLTTTSPKKRHIKLTCPRPIISLIDKKVPVILHECLEPTRVTIERRPTPRVRRVVAFRLLSKKADL